MQAHPVVRLPPRGSIQSQLLTMVLVFMVPVTLVWGGFLWSQAQEAEDTAYTTVRALAGQVATQLNDTLQNYAGVTTLLAQEFDPARKQWDRGFSSKQFLRLHPELVSVGLYIPRENPVPSSGQDLTRLAEHLDRVWSRLPAEKLPSAVEISGVVWEDAYQRWVAVLSHPVSDAQGRSMGLVYLTLDLLKLSHSFMGAIPDDVVMPVLDREDRMLMRSMAPEQWIGKKPPTNSLAAAQGKRNEDFAAPDLAGHSRLYAVRTLEASGWRVLAGVSKASALGSGQKKLARGLALGGFTLLALLAAIAWRARGIAQPILELQRAALRMQSDQSYRTPVQGPAEVKQVGQQLNALLDSIATEKLERRALTDHYASIINNARDCIFMLDESKHIVDCNPAALTTYGYSREELHRMTAADLRAPEAQSTTDDDWAATGDVRGTLFETVHQNKNGTTFPVEVSSNRFIRDGKTYVQSFVRDISERKRTEHALLRQTRALMALSGCNHALVGATTQQALLDQVCSILANTAGYPLAWVGRPEHDEEKHVTVWAQAGKGVEYLNKIQIRWSDTPLGRGPTGTALREMKTVLAHDLAKQADYEPWRPIAAAQGFAASIAIPLETNDNCLGVLTVYTADKGVFDPTEVELLEELAGNVAHGMAALNTQQRATHLQTQLGESERRFQMLIEQAPVGIYVLRHGLFVYANPRMDDIMGMPYGTLVGQNALRFVHADDQHILSEATERMKLLGTTGNLQVRCLRKDGVMIEIGMQNVRSNYEGEPAIIGMAQDVSERNRTQAEIARYVQRLEQTTEATLQAVSNMVEMRDPYTAGHERRVGELAGAIGAEMGLSAHDIKGLRLAGFVHDVGKIAVPAELLAKPSRLTEAEMALIRVHSQAGYDVLKGVDFPWPIADVILQHHERLDGTGYPRGLIGEAILLEARIMMVADVVESMSSHRPYRPGLGLDAALAEITQHSGVRYDPAVVAACYRLFKEKSYVIA